MFSQQQTSIDEEEPLFVKEETTLTSQSQAAKYTWRLVRLSFFLIGAGAGALYIGPAKTCAGSDTCGKWLTDFTNEGFATTAFAAGGLDFSLINALFSEKSLPVFVEYIQKQRNLAAKMGKGTIIILSAAAQNVPTFLTASSTSTAYWQTILSVTGTAPGALYGAVNLMDNEIPFVLHMAKRYLIKMQRAYVDRFMSLNESEWQLRKRMMHYEKLHCVFIEELHTRLRYVTTHARSLDMPITSNPLDSLFIQCALHSDSSWLENKVHQLGALLGLGIGANISLPFVLNTYRLLKDYIPGMPLQILSALFLNASSIYGNVKISMAGVTGLLDSLIQLCQGKPINSLPFQLRPKTSTAIYGASILLSFLSYALINNLVENEVPGSGPGYDAYRYSEMFSIDFYHATGLVHTYYLLFSLFTPKQKENFLFQLEKEVDRFTKMSLDDFISFVDNNHSSKNILYNLQSYDSDALLPDEESLPISTNNKNLAAGDISPKTATATKSCFGSWCSYFWRSKEGTNEAQIENNSQADLGLTK